MVAKYDEKTVLNIHLYWDEKSEDLDNVLFTQNGIFAQKTHCESTINGLQGKIDVTALSTLGTNLLNDMSSACNFYHLAIPSRECFRGSHAVAMAVDNKTKIIYYHDSHGEDMRKEMKDYLGLLLTEYKIDVNHSKQQQDVANPLVSSENDNSCVLLTKYNLRDMWYKMTRQEDKICNFSSIEARKDAWNILKDIQKKEETEKKTEPTRPKINFGAKKLSSTADLESQKRAEEEDFKYRMYNEPNYPEMLQEAVKNARSNHVAYCKKMMASIQNRT